MPQPMHILVTGATGYVGGRLVPRLLAAGHRVRCLVRDRDRLEGRAWLPQVEIVQGDMLEPATIAVAMRDIDVVYYLVHSLGGGADFSRRDAQAAENCARAASAAGVARISAGLAIRRRNCRRISHRGSTPAKCCAAASCP
jgi:uncharacterized protein YbjT (DUF2867 family)